MTKKQKPGRRNAIFVCAVAFLLILCLPQGKAFAADAYCATAAQLATAIADTAVTDIYLTESTYTLTGRLEITNGDTSTPRAVTFHGPPGGTTVYPAPGQRHMRTYGAGHITLTFENVVLDGGTSAAGTKQGGVYHEGTTGNYTQERILTLNSAVIQNCNANTNNGGAIYTPNIGASVNLNGCTITRNYAANYGGGVYVTGGILHVRDCEVSLNSAAWDGGGLYILGFDVAATALYARTPSTIEGTTAVSRNSAGEGNGGGIYVQNLYNTFPLTGLEISGDVLIDRNTAEGSAPYGYGGGIYLHSTGSGVIINGAGNVVISGNEAAAGGGVMLMANSKFFIEESADVEIKDNTAQNGNGGGVFLNAGEFRMQNGGKVVISGNKAPNASLGGGGVYVNSSSANKLLLAGTGQVVISGNTAQGDGGGVYLNTTVADTFLMQGPGEVVVSGNRATVNGGGIYAAKYISLSVTGGKTLAFSGNTAAALYPLSAGLTSISTFGDIPALAPGTVTGISVPGIRDANRGLNASYDTNELSSFNNYDINYLGGPVYWSIAFEPGRAGADAADMPSPNPDAAEDGASYDVPAGAPSWAGHTFTGWLLTAGTALKDSQPAVTGTTAFDPGDSLTPASDVTLTAQWTYAAAYDANGGTGGPPAAEYGYSDTMAVRFDQNPARAGHDFLGWDEDAGAAAPTYTAGGLTQFSITHDTTLYAVWAASTYGVAYHANGGTGSVPSDATAYSSGGTVTVLFAPRPARAGHIFLGWDEDAGAAAPAYTESGLDHFNITSDTALYAVWEAIPQAATYGVSYDANGGTGSVPSDAASYGSGDTVTVLFTPRPARAGYAFLGWDENAGAAAPDYTESGLDHFDVTADTFLYAIWEAETQGGDIYTVTFNSNGGTVAPGDETRTVSASAVSASAVTLGAIMPPDPARAGYTFLGWNTRSDGSGTAFAASTPVTADIAVYALWAPAGGGGSGSTGGGTTTPPVTPDPPDEPPAPAEPPEATPPPEEPAQNLPSPSAPGHVLVPGSGGTYIEMGEDGIPLGEWHWDEPTQTWVFEEYPPPLANDALPQTGETRPGGFDLYGFLLLTFMLAVIGAGVLIRGRHRGIHRKQ